MQKTCLLQRLCDLLLHIIQKLQHLLISHCFQSALMSQFQTFHLTVHHINAIINETTHPVITAVFLQIVLQMTVPDRRALNIDLPDDTNLFLCLSPVHRNPPKAFHNLTIYLFPVKQMPSMPDLFRQSL